MKPHYINIKSRLPKVIHPFTAAIAFWLSLAGAVIQTGLMILGNIYTEAQIIDTRLHIALMGVATFIEFFTLFLFTFYIMKRDWNVASRFGIAVPCTTAATVVYTLIEQSFAYWIYNEPLQDELLYLDLIKNGIVAITVILITLALFNITRRQQIVLENEQLQAENLQVRLTSLENQVDPHFLFNSLNTLDGLIGVDDERAHSYLQQLASSYRYIIRQQRTFSTPQSKDSPNLFSTLADELAFAESYTYLMQIRYGSNLQVIRHIDPRWLNAQVVPISIQLLIENAIKHNVVSDRHPLAITIETTDRDTLRVSNPRQAKDDVPEGSGIGLSNLSKRYQLLCHRDIIIEADEQCFAIEIPLIQ